MIAPPGGISQVATAAGSGLAAFAAAVLPGASGPDGDARQRRARADAGVTAILHESALVRYWDHDLGPDQQRLRSSTCWPPRTPGARPPPPAGPRPGRCRPRVT